MTGRDSAPGAFAHDLMGNGCLLASCFYTLSSSACFFYFVVLWSFLVLLPWPTLQNQTSFYCDYFKSMFRQEDVPPYFFPFEELKLSVISPLAFSPSSFPVVYFPNESLQVPQ